jgi:predicted Rossmann fold nucleotide-binding protein DprA/Smf involved in DNA uptake
MNIKNIIPNKWAAISGSWAITDRKIEKDVRKYVRKIIKSGMGIVTGGALNVDSFATDESIKIDPSCNHIKIFLPTTLKIYAAHYRKRAKEGVITTKQAENLISQLENIKKINPNAIIENKINKEVNKTTYFERNTKIVEASDELYVFHAIESTGGGTSDTIEKAKKLGIPFKKLNYKVCKN